MDFSAIFNHLTRKQKIGVGKYGSISLETGDFEVVHRKDDEADINVTNLEKKWEFGEYAVRGTTFKAYRGEITGLLGHNGAGKSTTFSCLTGYTAPTGGKVEICGYDVTENIEEVRKNIGYCPQGNPLFGRLTCLEHLQLAARLRGSYHGDKDCKDVLYQVGLGGQESVVCDLLSLCDFCENLKYEKPK